MTTTGGHVIRHPGPREWTCAVCEWEWDHRPRTSCPGLPRYGPGRPEPPYLKTKTDLKKAGKNPGGPPRGAVLQIVSNEYHELYDEREAVPRRKTTPAQAAALAAGREARERRLRCSRCGEKLTARERGQGLRGICELCVLISQREEEREHSIRWARGLLASGDFCVVDFETTGLVEPDLVEAAVVDASGRILFESQLRPMVPVEPRAREVHGIGDEILAGAPDLADVHADLLAALSGRPVVCYNAEFDAGAWRAACARRGLPAEGEGDLVRWEDAMGRWADYNSHLSPLPGGDHTAAGDARATLALLRSMAGPY